MSRYELSAEPKVKLITLTETLVILHITNTSSNDFERKFKANMITLSIKYCDKWYEKLNLFTHLSYENVPYNTKNCQST